ncbi:MAG: 50S ribosomal protein L10 [Candidatus Roizmanbacteria bacterium]|nr:50S ribosomal protein L10 [Candidatus Roizmanbacteria bacterium]
MKLKFRLQRKPRELREERIQQLSQEIDGAQAVMLFTSTHVTHQQFEELRKRLAPLKAKLRFVKNTLFKQAAQGKSLPEALYEDKILFEQSGVIFAYSDDVASVVKTFAELFKGTETITFKIGWIDGTVYDPQQVLSFASMPTKHQLYGRLASMLQSPIQQLHYALRYDISRLAVAINAISSKQS